MFSLLSVLVVLQTTFDIAYGGGGLIHCSGPDGSSCSLFLGVQGCCCGGNCWVPFSGPCSGCGIFNAVGERTNNLVTAVQLDDEKNLPACLGGAGAGTGGMSVGVNIQTGRQTETAVSTGFRSHLVLWGAIALMGAVLFGGVWAFARKADTIV